MPTSNKRAFLTTWRPGYIFVHNLEYQLIGKTL